MPNNFPISQIGRLQKGNARLVFWLILSMLVLIFSIYFNWSYWGKSGLLDDDIHREFVTPLRLNQGEALYKDFHFIYAPLPPYINSVIVRLHFFDTFTILRVVALGLFLLNLLFLWFICRDIELSWIFGPILFGIVTWTNYSTFNPTSFNYLYSTLFATFGIWASIRSLKNEKWAWFGLGIAVAGALLSKPEGLFVVGLAFIAASICHYRSYKKIFGKEELSWLAGFLSLVMPFVLFLFNKGLSFIDIIEGLLQMRFQQKLSEGFVNQYQYFYGINGVLVIAAGCIFIALLFYLIKLYHQRQRLVFWPIFFVSFLAALILVFKGQLIRILNDYQNLGDFFGGILGYWWYRQLPEGNPKKGFFIFWLASLGEWLRPLFHVGALVIPFRSGGGMLLAVIFWFLMLPSLFKRFYPNLIENLRRVKNIFIKIGYTCVFMFGLTGLYLSWNGQYKYPSTEFKTPYGNFLVDRDFEGTQAGIEVIGWVRNNLASGKRVVVLEGLPVELTLGWLPCMPLSHQSHQIYDGDLQRIIAILELRQDIEFVIVQVRLGGYNFGVQDYKLADYLDTEWRQAARFKVPEQLTVLSNMSPERKKDSGLVRGFIIYERK